MPAAVDVDAQFARRRPTDFAFSDLAWGVLLALLVLAAYSPALRGGFIWDDEVYISNNPALHSAAGLKQIWLTPGATCQYYPLTFTLLWIGYQIWGLNTLGYHLLTLGFHILASLLLWRILARLKVPGAWLAGAIFALHPVNVMSVAWMTELKNTLSATLALASVWTYLRATGLGGPPGDASAAPRGRSIGTSSSRIARGWYWLALALFVLGMLAKTAVFFVPVSLLLVTWWRRGRVGWRELWPVIPMLGLVPFFSALTAYVERLTGGTGHPVVLSWLERTLISGRSFWFYLGKLIFPYPLILTYPRWTVDTRAGWQYLYPLALLALFVGLWRGRTRLGRGALAAFGHFYVSTSMFVLVMVLNFMIYSFVADHWQYFGCMSVIALAAAGISLGLDELLRERRVLKASCCGLLLLLLATLTWGEAWLYRDDMTAWNEVLAQNEKAWNAHVIVGNHLFDAGQWDDAMTHYRRAIELNPGEAMPHANYARALWLSGKFDLAEEEFQKAIGIAPNYFLAHANYCDLLIKRGKLDAAQGEVEKLTQLAPDSVVTLYHAGYVSFLRGNAAEAERSLNRAVEVDPDYGPARLLRARLFQQQGRLNEAVAEYQIAVRLLPDSEHARDGLAETRQQLRHSPDANPTDSTPPRDPTAR